MGNKHSMYSCAQCGGKMTRKQYNKIIRGGEGDEVAKEEPIAETSNNESGETVYADPQKAFEDKFHLIWNMMNSNNIDGGKNELVEMFRILSMLPDRTYTSDAADNLVEKFQTLSDNNILNKMEWIFALDNLYKYYAENIKV